MFRRHETQTDETLEEDDSPPGLLEPQLVPFEWPRPNVDALLDALNLKKRELEQHRREVATLVEGVLAGPPMLWQIHNDIDFNRRLVTVEQQPGPRYLVKAGLSVLQIRPDIRARWRREEQIRLADPWSENDLEEYRRGLEVRRSNFLKQVEATPFYEVCTTDALTDFVLKGRLPADDVDPAWRDKVEVPAEDRRPVIEGVIDQLRRLPNYHLARLTENDSYKMRSFWEVKGDSLLAHIFPEALAGGRQNVVVQSAPLAAALEQYFLREIWEKIPSERRENDAVADFMDSLLRQGSLL